MTISMMYMKIISIFFLFIYILFVSMFKYEHNYVIMKAILSQKKVK